MRIIFLFFLSLFLFIFQSTILSRVSIYGVSPNLLLIVSIFLVLYYIDFLSSAIFVLFSGFLLNMYSGVASGAVLISFILSIVIIYFLTHIFFTRGNFFYFCFIAMLGSILYFIIYSIILNLYDISNISFVFEILIAQLILNVMAGALIYPVRAYSRSQRTLS